MEGTSLGVGSQNRPLRLPNNAGAHFPGIAREKKFSARCYYGVSGAHKSG